MTRPALAITPPTPQEASPLAIEANDVCKRYGTKWALARLSFTLKAGESLLLTGHNGSGKTTLLKLISTAMFPSLGTLKVLGLDGKEEREKIRRNVGLLSHASFHYEDLSSLQNLRVFTRLLGIRSREDVIARALDRVRLTPHAHTPVRQFSAGMKKRLSIARLLIKAPSLVLLDEPFGELDPEGIAEMEKIIAEMKGRQTTLVLATHQIEQGLALCSQRLHLSSGQAA